MVNAAGGCCRTVSARRSFFAGSRGSVVIGRRSKGHRHAALWCGACSGRVVPVFEDDDEAGSSAMAVWHVGAVEPCCRAILYKSEDLTRAVERWSKR